MYSGWIQWWLPSTHVQFLHSMVVGTIDSHTHTRHRTLPTPTNQSSNTMFLPENVNTALKEEEIRKAAFKDIEKWSSEIIPPNIRPDCVVSVQELLCGDPQCSPIDTAVTLTFTR